MSFATPSAGFADSARGSVWLSGSGRMDFLHRLTTGAMSDLQVGHGRATIILTDTGRVVDYVSAYNGAEGTLLVTSAPASAPVVAAHLKSYRLYGDDVNVTDATSQVTVLTVLHGLASAWAEIALACGLDELPQPGQWRRSALGPPGEAELWCLGHVGPRSLGGADLVMPCAAADRLRATLVAAGLPAATAGSYALARIRAGLPAFGHEIGTDAQTNPLELDLARAVDFSKGCYTGQEVVARLDTYKKVQRRLVRLESPAQLVEGTLLHPGGDRESAASRSPVTGAATPRSRHQGVRVTTAAFDGVVWRALALAPVTLEESADLGASTKIEWLDPIATPSV